MAGKLLVDLHLGLTVRGSRHSSAILIYRINRACLFDKHAPVSHPAKVDYVITCTLGQKATSYSHQPQVPTG